jgi:hypothetical protein
MFVLIIFGMAACDDFMDVHKKYIQDGEIIYAPKPVYLQFWTGVERMTLICILKNAPNVKTIDIYWNNKQDSLIFPVSPSKDLDVYTISIENLESGSYTFTVRTTDAFGQHSLEVTGFGNVLDPDFVNNLKSRVVDHLNITATVGTIFWGPVPENLLYNEVRYTTNAGENTLLKVLPNESTTKCPDVERKMAFAEYRSLFIPENSLDTIFGEWQQTAFRKEPIYIYGPGVNNGANNFALYAIALPFDEANPYVYVWEGACVANWFRYQAYNTGTGLNFRPDTGNESPNGFASAGDDAVTNWTLNKPDLGAGNYRITLNFRTPDLAHIRLSRF